MVEQYNEYAALFKALSDPNRLLIIEDLLEGERCACVLLEQLQITQSTLSYHMKILTDCDIVCSKKEGKWMHYSLNRTRLQELKVFLECFSKERPVKVVKCTEK